MLDKSEKEITWPSARYFGAVSEIIGLYKRGEISEMDAVKRIACVEPDCDMDDCNEAVSLPVCRECERWMNMEA